MTKKFFVLFMPILFFVFLAAGEVSAEVDCDAVCGSYGGLCMNDRGCATGGTTLVPGDFCISGYPYYYNCNCYCPFSWLLYTRCAGFPIAMGCSKNCDPSACYSDSECLCPTDSCIGNDYYNYPAYGDCDYYYYGMSRIGSCSCLTGTSVGQPCAPVITYNDSRCRPPCSYNFECSDGDSCTTDTCVNPGTSYAYCSHVPVPCNYCQACSFGQCRSTSVCAGTETSCGCNYCSNCTINNGCFLGQYQSYSCLNYHCTLTSLSCTETCCDQYYGDSNAYCSGGTCFPPPSCPSCQYPSGGQCYPFCSGTDTSCGCSSCSNCNAWDGWANSGGNFPCCEGQQYCSYCQVQEYRDYYCSGTGCTYSVVNWQTVKSSCSLVDGQCGYVANHAPSQPQIPSEYLPDGISWQNCTFEDESTPTFHWTYSDSDSDPMAAYEIEVDENDAFLVPKFNHLVNLASTAYTLDLRQDDENPDNLPSSLQDYELDWNATYFWRVRVKDNKGLWSVWSQPKQFKTLQTSYPYPGFTWEPQEPNMAEVVVFTPDNLTATTYLWEIIEGSGEFVDDTTAASQIPHIKLTATSNSIQLTVTNSEGSCSKEQDLTAWYPLPHYKEVSPSSFFDLERLFSAAAALTQAIFR